MAANSKQQLEFPEVNWICKQRCAKGRLTLSGLSAFRLGDTTPSLAIASTALIFLTISMRFSFRRLSGQKDAHHAR